MSNIHTIYDNPQPIPNFWNEGKNSNKKDTENRTSWGKGESISGKKAKNPWAQTPSQQAQPNTFGAQSGTYGAHYTSDTEMQVVFPSSSSQDMEENPEAFRQFNGHLFDPFWTDNIALNPPPGYGPIILGSCGCGCCIGPCCSEIRKKDYLRLLLTFTFIISVIQMLVMIVEWIYGGTNGGIHWPEVGPTTEVLINMGAKYLYSIRCKYQVFRYITPIVLHAGLFHIIFNLFFQYRVMLSREVYWGILKTILIYTVSGIGGNVLSLAWYYEDPSVGASGALMGVFGAYIIDIIKLWKYYQKQQKIMTVVQVVLFIVIMVVLGFVIPGIDNGAHLGGLFSGFFLGMIVLQKKLVFRIIGGVCLAVFFIVPTVLTYTVIKMPC